jgi:hypothetical protein
VDEGRKRVILIAAAIPAARKLAPVRHSEILPEQDCGGELIELPEDEPYVHFAQCARCGTEFTYVPDSDWVTVVYPGMRN